MDVKCYFCGNLVDKQKAIKYKKHNFHEDCCKKQKERDELNEYICKLFGLKLPGPRNNALISKYVENGYTYIGIKKALIYFFEINKGSISKAKEGIGIVPSVYDIAQDYFNNIKKRQDKIFKQINMQKKEEGQVEVVKVVKRRSNGKKYLDILKWSE